MRHGRTPLKRIPLPEPEPEFPPEWQGAAWESICDTEPEDWTPGDEIQASAIAEHNSPKIPGNY